MISKKVFFLGVMTAGIIGSLLSLLVVFTFVDLSSSGYDSIDARQKSLLTSQNLDSSYKVPDRFNFLDAAESVLPGVVHIRTSYGDQGGGLVEDFFHDFNIRKMPSQSSGSGVIISDDGYIATNHHVIEKASRIEVTLSDNRSYQAKLVGSDPTTDLALLKIDDTHLPFVKYGNSDDIRLGEWVLAIGNPFNLNSTVTAGIISAKARNIGILRRQNNLQIESFIQTDAVVNPGNSGGALVNLDGDLIGINTAIATNTGQYAGYSFAIPVTLVTKVMDDLLKYGKVQRGLLGIYIGDVNAQVAKNQNLDVFQGVFITEVHPNSAAEEAGLLDGDVITGINGRIVSNVSELQELVARKRPGDTISVDYRRNGTEDQTLAILKGTDGTRQLVIRDYPMEYDGAVFRNLTEKELATLKVKGGVLIEAIEEGPWSRSEAKPGFVITHVDKVAIMDMREFSMALENKNGALLIEGLDLNGDAIAFAVNK